MLKRLTTLFLCAIVGCGESDSSSGGDGSGDSSGNSGSGGVAGSNLGGGGTGGSAAASGGFAGADCDCALGAYIPVCGVDGMTYDATCGDICVLVGIQCRGECPCDGSGGSGGAGAGGSGGDASCTNPDSGTFATEYETRGTTVGENGSFSDECDADGNLVEYGCEVDSSTCTFPNPSPDCYRVTGQVVPATVDCSGTCETGACASLCAHTGDEFSYESIDRATGAATLRNLNREAVYVCELTWDRTTDEFDCIADPNVGDTTAIVAFGAATTFCLPGETSGFGVQPEGTTRQECSYECTTQ